MHEYVLLLLLVLEYLTCDVLPHVHLVIQLGQDDHTPLVVVYQPWDRVEHDCRKLLTTASALQHLHHQTEHIFAVGLEDEITHDTVFQFNEREFGLF